MKKIKLLSLLMSSGFTLLNAQSFNFESWVNVSISTTVKDPSGFASFNIANVLGFGMNQTVFKETTAPYAGTASAKIVTDILPSALGTIPNPFKAGDNLDTVGVLALGAISISPPGIKYGQPYAYRPAVISFACKYVPVANDSAFVITYLTRYNGTGRDTIASGVFGTGAIAAYAVQNINLTYNTSFSTVMPDTLNMYVSSSKYKSFGAKVGSAFYIDNISWSGYNSVSEVNGKTNSVSHFPNPALQIINFKSSLNSNFVQLSDITGRLVGMYEMKNNETKIDVGNFVDGFYFYTILNEKKEVTARGKFEVIH